MLKPKHQGSRGLLGVYSLAGAFPVPTGVTPMTGIKNVSLLLHGQQPPLCWGPLFKDTHHPILRILSEQSSVPVGRTPVSREFAYELGCQDQRPIKLLMPLAEDLLRAFLELLCVKWPPWEEGLARCPPSCL